MGIREYIISAKEGNHMYLIYDKDGSLSHVLKTLEAATLCILSLRSHMKECDRSYVSCSAKFVKRISEYPKGFWELVGSGAISMSHISFTELRARRLDPSGFGDVQKTFHDFYIVDMPDAIYNAPYGRYRARKLGFVGDRLEENRLLQIDPATGNVVDEFRSSSEAERNTDILASSICHVASSQPRPIGADGKPDGQAYRTAGGYIWRWKHPKKKVHMMKTSSGKPKACSKVDERGNALAHYASLTAAAEANGISTSYVHIACNGMVDERRYPKEMRPSLLRFRYD